jgi:hypothetical protein
MTAQQIVCYTGLVVNQANPDRAAGRGDPALMPTGRLIHVLRIYCGVFGDRGVEDLRSALSRGLYLWLRSDLGAAIRSTNVDAAWWSQVIGTPARTETDDAEDIAAVRRLWECLYPSHRFPARSRPTRPRRAGSR